MYGRKWFKNVITVFNSGNILFERDIEDKQVLSDKLSALISNYFNIDIPVLVLCFDELIDIVGHVPEWMDLTDKSKYHNVIFMFPGTTFEKLLLKAGTPSEGLEHVENYKNAVFWSYSMKGFQKANWWKNTAKGEIKNRLTVRTVNTLLKMIKKEAGTHLI